jgi:GNAT superfamily N-acetyltransferase
LLAIENKRTSVNIEISSDLGRLKIADIHEMLVKAVWCPGITEKEINKGIRNSALGVGAYLEDQRQVGFLRVISDKVRFAYILDVIVTEEYQRKGIGQKMVQFAMAHRELRDVYHWLLATRDAHGVYEKCGFQKLQHPEFWMSILKPRPDRTQYED